MDRRFAALACAALLTACPDAHEGGVGDGGASGADFGAPAPGEGELCAPIDSLPPPCDGAGRRVACNAEAITRALADAEAGDVVRIGACEIEGGWTVPPGVTLEGAGPDMTRLVGSPQRSVVTLEPGETPATVRCLSITSEAPRGAVAAAGAGRATVAHVRMDVVTGVGVYAEGLEAVRLHGVRVIGPFTPDNAASAPSPVPESTATHGIALIDVAHAAWTDVTARGFAAMGVLAGGSEIAWREGDIGGNVGTGLWVHESRACIRDVVADEQLQGVRIVSAIGVALASQSELRALRLTARGVEGLGMLVSGSAARLEEGLFESNTDGAIWVQRGDIELDRTVVVDNRLVGMLVCEAGVVSVRDCTFARTERAPRVTRNTGLIELGLGLGIARTGHVELTRTRLESHDTVGLLFDLAQDAPLPVLSEVTVRSERTALGALAYRRQDTAVDYLPLGSWDEGIRREGTAAENDAAFVERVANLPETEILHASSCLQHVPVPEEL